ncbi:MAG: glycosyltransferase [Solirubrobacterales bacterium]|nr:glycosyltransferase [Solirubrobacterales bacterium]MBV9472722.1 glycosyltransferase [Solirubrobacterales bacterium]
MSASASNPFFSVVIPAYNAERFLAEALACVQRQTYSGLECMVVDDGSTDGTLATARSFEADARFRVLSIAHGASPGRARNHGIRAAVGEYVALLDADDLWTDDKLERCFELIRDTGATVMFSNGHVIDERGRRISHLLSPRMKRALPPRDPLLVVTNVVPVASVVAKRTVLCEHPFSQDTRIRGAEDYVLWLELNARYPLHYINEPLLLYRCHPGQMHRDHSEQLRKWERIIVDPTIAQSHGEGAVALTRSLIELRKRYAEGGVLRALRGAPGVLRWLATPQRGTLLAYLRFGLLQRARTMIRQKRSGASVGV